MLDKETIRLKVTGDYACFTRPDLKVERMSYPCMTPSAARGVLEAILWKKEFQWFIKRIIVLNPIKFSSIQSIRAEHVHFMLIPDSFNLSQKHNTRFLFTVNKS